MAMIPHNKEIGLEKLFNALLPLPHNKLALNLLFETHGRSHLRLLLGLFIKIDIPFIMKMRALIYIITTSCFILLDHVDNVWTVFLFRWSDSRFRSLLAFFGHLNQIILDELLIFGRRNLSLFLVFTTLDWLWAFILFSISAAISIGLEFVFAAISSF